MTQEGSGLEDCIYPIPVNKKRKRALYFLIFDLLSKTQISIEIITGNFFCCIFDSDAEVS